MTPRICVSILPKTDLEALTLIKKAEEVQANLIEIRLDFLETSRNISELVKSTKIPLIATNKLTTEHGFFSGTETQRQQTLLNAAKNSFEYIDVDLSSPKHKETIDQLKQLGAKPIVSFHKFEGPLTLSEMETILETEISIGADICKIIGTASTTADNLAALNFLSSNSNKAKIVCFCMGEAGRVSRLISPMFGAFFTFASLEQGNETALGQMTATEMRLAYHLLGE